MREMALLRCVCDAYRAILGDRLTGFYVHGSVALGCFFWATGDIDFLCVAESPLTQQEKEALIRTLLDLAAQAPAKGFEMSVVLRAHCRPFRHPMPFELHFSNAHRDRAEAELSAFCHGMNGRDPDLAAHVTVLHHAGLTLYGPPVAEVFGPVAREDYLDSILSDVSGAAEVVTIDPVYFTLNLCRVLAYLTEGVVLSKAQGGQWGLRHLPEAYHPLLTGALNAYRTGERLPAQPLLTDFASTMLRSIRSRL